MLNSLSSSNTKFKKDFNVLIKPKLLNYENMPLNDKLKINILKTHAWLSDFNDIYRQPSTLALLSPILLGFLSQGERIPILASLVLFIGTLPYHMPKKDRKLIDTLA